MDKVRCKLCWHCRENLRSSRNRSTNIEGQCKLFIQALSNNSTCVLCNSNDNIEFDHIDPKQKVYKLSDYSWWKCHGGVKAMKEESKKCRPLCRFCHDQQKTTYQKRRYEDIDSMPRKTKLHTILFLQAKYRKQKMEHNIEQKVKRNQCKYCGLKVDQTNSVSFHWAHIDPTTKSLTISNLVNDHHLTSK